MAKNESLLGVTLGRVWPLMKNIKLINLIVKTVREEVSNYLIELSQVDLGEQQRREKIDKQAKDLGFDEWLSVKEVASQLRVTPRTVRRWIHEGAIKPMKIMGRVIVPISEIKKLIA